MTLQSENMGVLILLSGGIDSASCVAFYQCQGLRVSGLFVDYGQTTRFREKDSASRLAQHFDIPLNAIECSAPTQWGAGEIRGRNAFLVLTALMFQPHLEGLLALGIHAGTPYYDCSQIFLDDLQRIISAYSGGKVVVTAPFIDWTKPMIYQFAERMCVPLEATWSCEVGPDEPCGKCLSCRDRKELNVRTS